jgi:hypothetical protein
VSLALELTSCAGQQVVSAYVMCVPWLLVMVSQTAHVARPHLVRSAPFCSACRVRDVLVCAGLAVRFIGCVVVGSGVTNGCGAGPSDTERVSISVEIRMQFRCLDSKTALGLACFCVRFTLTKCAARS